MMPQKKLNKTENTYPKIVFFLNNYTDIFLLRLTLKTLTEH